jgi:hypothetical protein
MYVKTFEKDSVAKLDESINDWMDINPGRSIVDVTITPVQHFKSDSLAKSSTSKMQYMGVIKYIGKRADY